MSKPTPVEILSNQSYILPSLMQVYLVPQEQKNHDSDSAWKEYDGI